MVSKPCLVVTSRHRCCFHTCPSVYWNLGGPVCVAPCHVRCVCVCVHTGGGGVHSHGQRRWCQTDGSPQRIDGPLIQLESAEVRVHVRASACVCACVGVIVPARMCVCNCICLLLLVSFWICMLTVVRCKWLAPAVLTRAPIIILYVFLSFKKVSFVQFQPHKMEALPLSQSSSK